MSPSNSVPSHRVYKPSGQAVVRIRRADGSKHDVYPGKYKSPEPQSEYSRTIPS